MTARSNSRARSAPEHRAIDPQPFMAAISKTEKLPPLGAAPQLQWIDIAKLIVDPSYQRDIQTTGRKNVLRIAREFDWTKFAPVVVAPIEGGKYAIVDGQHRTTSAAMRGIKSVPCQVIVADPAKQAAAFAAINANITEMSPMQLHAARVAAGDEAALNLTQVCADAGVTICRYPIKTTDQKRGETMSVGALYRQLAKCGPDVLTVVLSCVTRTRDGYPGLLRNQMISALCAVFKDEPDWCESRKLLKAMGGLNLADAFSSACTNAKPGSGGGIVGELACIIRDHLEARLRVVAA